MTKMPVKRKVVLDGLMVSFSPRARLCFFLVFKHFRLASSTWIELLFKNLGDNVFACPSTRSTFTLGLGPELIWLYSGTKLGEL